ncbi:MAG: hypothetical protein Q9201_005401 [Fulgogasparrea decipioides]
MIRLSLCIAPYISGYVHTQTNPIKAYDTEAIVANALRKLFLWLCSRIHEGSLQESAQSGIVSLYGILDKDFDVSRICIKIPSTWEGLQACRILQVKGIKTLATTLFAFEQGALAGQVGCQYIAPYVHELKVQTSPGHVDRSPNNALCVLLQKYYTSRSLPTKVLAASLTSVEEVMALAGIDHITLPPPLLQQLANLAPSDKQPSLFDQNLDDEQPRSFPSIETKDDFDRALRMSNGGNNQRKLDQVSSFRFTSRLVAKNPIF